MVKNAGSFHCFQWFPGKASFCPSCSSGPTLLRKQWKLSYSRHVQLVGGALSSMEHLSVGGPSGLTTAPSCTALPLLMGISVRRSMLSLFTKAGLRFMASQTSQTAGNVHHNLLGLFPYNHNGGEMSFARGGLHRMNIRQRKTILMLILYY